MDLKRILTGVIGFPVAAAILILSNTYIFDIVIAFIAFVMMDEYCKSFQDKKAKPIKWISYLSCASIALIHVIPTEYIKTIIICAVPIMGVILFLHVILSNMKINIIDISVTLFGIAYIVLFFAFVAILRGVEHGRLLVWYIFFAAWGTDILAFVIGRHFGKHYFSEISPKKTIEGCIGGIIGAVVFVLIYTLFINKYFGMNINYYIIAGFAVIWSLLGQIGDFAASTIKRFNGIKDFSNLLPGHGGMLDRFDSVIFIAPFAYVLLKLFI